MDLTTLTNRGLKEAETTTKALRWNANQMRDGSAFGRLDAKLEAIWREIDRRRRNGINI